MQVCGATRRLLRRQSLLLPLLLLLLLLACAVIRVVARARTEERLAVCLQSSSLFGL
jgi:hypothetical protein